MSEFQLALWTSSSQFLPDKPWPNLVYFCFYSVGIIIDLPVPLPISQVRKEIVSSQAGKSTDDETASALICSPVHFKALNACCSAIRIDDDYDDMYILLM